MSTTRTRATSLATAVALTSLSMTAVPTQAWAVTPGVVRPTTGTAPEVAGSAEQDRFEARVVRLTNSARGHRRKCGGKWMKKVRALSWSPALASSADGHSADMATNDFFSHYSRSGASPFDRMRAAGYSHRPAGENIAAGLPGAAAVVQAWLRSPGHCRAIMDPRAREIGVGRIAGSGRFEVYWTQDFGALK